MSCKHCSTSDIEWRLNMIQYVLGKFSYIENSHAVIKREMEKALDALERRGLIKGYITEWGSNLTHPGKIRVQFEVNAPWHHFYIKV